MLTAGIYPGGVTREAAAEVNIKVNIGPPLIMVDEPAEVVYAPGLGFYFVPDGEFDIFFFSGFWWSRRGDHWYRSRYYRRGWAITPYRDVPGPIFSIPRDYRIRFGREKRIRYQDWKGHPGQPSKTRGGGVRNESRGENWENKQPGADNTGGGIAPKNAVGNGGNNADRGGSWGKQSNDSKIENGGDRAPEKGVKDARQSSEQVGSDREKGSSGEGKSDGGHLRE